MDETTAGTVSGGREDEVAFSDRRRTVGGMVSRCIISPQEFAVLGRDANDASAKKLHVLSLAVRLGFDGRGVTGAVSFGHLGFPDGFTRLLVERDQRCLTPAGRHNQLVAVNER